MVETGAAVCANETEAELQARSAVRTARFTAKRAGRAIDMSRGCGCGGGDCKIDSSGGLEDGRGVFWLLMFDFDGGRCYGVGVGKEDESEDA